MFTNIFYNAKASLNTMSFHQNPHFNVSKLPITFNRLKFETDEHVTARFFLQAVRCVCFPIYYLTVLSFHCVPVSMTAILQWADRFVWWVGARVITEHVTVKPLKGMTGHKCHCCDISQVKVKGNYEYEVSSKWSSAWELLKRSGRRWLQNMQML